MEKILGGIIMKKEILLLGALTLATNAYAEPRNLSHDLVDKKNILGYVALPEGYHQRFTAYIRHNDIVWLQYGDGENKKSYVNYVNDNSYISSISTQKVADIVVTAELYSSHDGIFEKLLEEYGIPDKEKNNILLHETMNKAAVLQDQSLHAEILWADNAYLMIINVPNGSGYIDGKWVLSEEDKRANDVVQSIKGRLKYMYGLR